MVAKVAGSGRRKQRRAVEVVPADAPTAFLLMPAALLGSVQAEQDAARSYRQNEKAPDTRRVYGSDSASSPDGARLAARCTCQPSPQRSQPSSPRRPTPAPSHRPSAGTSLPSATLTALPATPTSTDAELLGVTMRGFRRTVGTAEAKKAPATAGVVVDMLAHVPDSLTGKRDRALLLLGLACALPRSELVALQVADLEQSSDGLRVTIRRSKTDQEGRGHTVGVPAGGKLLVTERVAEWIQTTGITSGPIFRPINRHGQVLPAALTDTSVAAIVKAYAGHSPCAAVS